MKTTLKISAALALAGAIGSAQAVDVAANTGPTAGPPSLAAALGTLLDSISTAITTPTFTGTARAAVYDGPEAGTNLNFYYQFSNTGGGQGLNSLDAIARMTAGGFSNWATDVSQSADAFGDFVGGTVAANTVDRGNTGVVGFNFTPSGVMPGESTNIMEIRTNATAFTDNWIAVIDGTSGFGPSFSPTAAPAVPEPETYALMLAGLGFLGFVGKRRIGRGKPDDESREAALGNA